MKVVDIFKTPISLTYKMQTSISSSFGSATSILIICLILAFAAANAGSLFSTENPKVVTQETILSSFPSINLNEEFNGRT